jgi:DNA-binding NarL/FixJ family response regulator
MMTEPIRILLADDQELVRYGFRLVLDADARLDVVGEAADGVEAVEAAERLRPDVVLMDIRMPGMDGLAATETITAQLPSVRVLALTTFDLDEYAFGALRAGASGFLLKDTRPAELVTAILAVHRGDAVVAPRITAKLIEVAAPHLARAADVAERDAESTLAPLTAREREVFALIGRGATNGEIGAELTLTESTVKTHVGRILLKLGLRDRVQAVILAYELGVAGG